MIPAIGFIITIYASMRLLQVPIEASASPRKVANLWAISVVGILGILFFALDLLLAGTVGLEGLR